MPGGEGGLLAGSPSEGASCRIQDTLVTVFVRPLWVSSEGEEVRESLDQTGLLCSEMLAGTDELKRTPPVQDQRRHRGYNRVVLLLYLHYRQFTGDRLCAAVWELCTLICQSKRSGS